jgi:hypothetical protein
MADRTHPAVDMPDPEANESAAAKQQQIKLLHARLMTVYVYAINSVSRPGPLPQGAEPFKEWRPLTGRRMQNSQEEWQCDRDDDGNKSLRRKPDFRGWPRPVTIFLVKAHIRRRLRELRAIYTQIEQTAPDISSASNFRSWLRETQESLNKFSLNLGFSTLA